MKDLAIKFKEEHNIPDEVYKAIRGEDIDVPDGIEPDVYVTNVLESYKNERLDFIKAKHLKPLVDSAVEAKAKELYPATVNGPIKSLVTLFDLEKSDDDDLKSLIKKAKEKAESEKLAASKQVNPETSDYQEKLNKQAQQITDLNNQIASNEDKFTLELSQAVGKEREKAQSIMTQKLYAEEAAKIQDKLIASNLTSSLLSEVKRRGYKLKTVVPDSGLAPYLSIVNHDDTDALNLAGQKKISSVQELLLEVADSQSWTKRNNNDMRTDAEIARDAKKSKSDGAKSLANYFASRK